MSAYKKLNQQDSYISTYVSRKSWIASGSQYRELGINNIVGLSGSRNTYLYSADNVTAGNAITTASSAFNRRLIFDSVNHLYYNEFKNSVLITSSSYEAYLQSSYEVSGSRYLNTRVAIFSLPKEMYGTNIEPFSVSITPDFINSGSAETGSFDNYVHNNYSTEEGINSIAADRNLYIENIEFLFGSTGANCSFDHPDYIENESTYVDESSNEYLDTTGNARNCNEICDDGEGRLYFKYSIPRVYVGNVIYTHGQIIITDEIVAMYYNHYFDAVLKWKSNLPIYTHNFHCKLKSHEFNYSLNKTAFETTDGKLSNLLSGSSFAPYFTTVGLYNDANELVAVGKLGRPTPKSTETDMSVLVKLDMNFGSDRLIGSRTTEFIASDPEEDNVVVNEPRCIYYFTFRNYYYKGSTGTNQSLHGSPYYRKKSQTKRVLRDDGDYILYRKASSTTDICKKSNDNRKVFNTENFTILQRSPNFKVKKGLTSVCYVDVTVEKVDNITDNINADFNGFVFDFTQKDGSQYNETSNVNNRTKQFFRDKITSYLLSNKAPCTFEASQDAVSCLPS